MASTDEKLIDSHDIRLQLLLKKQIKKSQLISTYLSELDYCISGLFIHLTNLSPVFSIINKLL